MSFIFSTWSSICAAHIFLVCGLPLECGHQGILLPPHRSPLHSGIWSGLKLHRPHACYYKGCEFLCLAVLPCPETLFPCIIHDLGLLLSFLSTASSSLGRRGCSIDVPLRAEWSEVSCSLQLSWFIGSCVHQCLLQIEISLMRCERLIYSYNDTSLEFRSISFPFDRVIAVGFPLGPKSSLGFSVWQWCHIWVLSGGMGPKSNQNVVGNSTGVCATIAPVSMS